MLTIMPWTAGLFAVGILALTGLPPFGLFISEFALFRAGFVAHRFWLMGGALALLAVGFVALISHLNKMLYGPTPGGVKVGELDSWGWFLPLLISLAALVVFGLSLPAPVAALLNRIVEIVSQ